LIHSYALVFLSGLREKNFNALAACLDSFLVFCMLKSKRRLLFLNSDFFVNIYRCSKILAPIINKLNSLSEYNNFLYWKKKLNSYATAYPNLNSYANLIPVNSIKWAYLLEVDEKINIYFVTYVCMSKLFYFDNLY